MKHTNLSLSKTTLSDLDTLYLFQLEPEAIRLAAFTSKETSDKKFYIDKYSKFLTDPTIKNQTIRLDGEIVGSISKFIMFDEAEITYWIDRQYWGKGIATAALEAFLLIERTRPIHGRVAFDNYGSQKVLEHCGFVRIGEDKGFANGRGEEIEEYVYRLG